MAYSCFIALPRLDHNLALWVGAVIHVCVHSYAALHDYAIVYNYANVCICATSIFIKKPVCASRQPDQKPWSRLTLDILTGLADEHARRRSGAGLWGVAKADLDVSPDGCSEGDSESSERRCIMECHPCGLNHEADTAASEGDRTPWIAQMRVTIARPSAHISFMRRSMRYFYSVRPSSEVPSLLRSSTDGFAHASRSGFDRASTLPVCVSALDPLAIPTSQSHVVFGVSSAISSRFDISVAATRLPTDCFNQTRTPTEMDLYAESAHRTSKRLRSES